MNNYSEYKDWELILLLNEPKPTCDMVFHQLFQRHSKNLLSYCRYKIRDQRDAEDLFQEVWFQFHKAVKKRQTISTVQPFLVGIANRLIKSYRAKHIEEDRIFVYQDGIELDKIATPLSFPRTFEEMELVAMLKVGLTEIDEIYWETFILRKFNELSYPEIAKITNETEANIRQRFSRAFRMLKDYFKEYIENIKE